MSILLLCLTGCSAFFVLNFLKEETSFAILIGTFCFATVFCLITLVYYRRVKPLVFNDEIFMYRGKAYRYIRIDEIRIKGNSFSGAVYEVIVDGSKLYSFDDEYEGAKMFLYYLNCHNVPGTPR